MAKVEKKIKFRLNHDCGNPVCKGLPGDIIEVTQDVAQYLLERKGGTVVQDPPRRAVAASASETRTGDTTPAEVGEE